jgi:hypothetical protein
VQEVNSTPPLNTTTTTLLNPDQHSAPLLVAPLCIKQYRKLV